MADALALGASGSKAVQVQVLCPAPTQLKHLTELPMATEYAVADCDASTIQYRFTFPTIAEAAHGANLGDYVIAVQDGLPRPLNAEEQAELERCKESV
jgi:hypothetical protein